MVTIVATVKCVEWHNGSVGNPDYTNVSTAGQTSRYCTMDAVNPNTSNPIVVPSSSTRTSYWKHHSINFSGGTWTKIDNIKFYTDGNSSNWTYGSNGQVFIMNLSSGAPHGCPNNSYEPPHGVEGTEGYHIMNNASGHPVYNLSGYTVSVLNFSSGNAIVIDNNSYGSNGYSYAVVSQVQVDNDATQGEMADLTCTFQWDEI